MLKGNGKFYISRMRKTDAFVAYLYVSTQLVKDSQFPFKHKDELDISIDEHGVMTVKKKGVKD